MDSHLRPHWSWLLAGACLAMVLAGNVAGAWVIARARDEALTTAVLQVQVDLAERARSLEATLRAGAGELRFLASSGPLDGLPSSLRDADPTVARWRRLDAEGSLLRYLIAHPEIERMFVRNADGEPVLAVGRRASSPVPLPLEAVARGATAGRLREVIDLPGGEGELIADIHPAGLFSALATGTGRAVLLSSDGSPLAGTPEAFRRVRDSAALEAEEGPDWVSVEMRVEPSGLPPGEHWLLARAEKEDELLAGLGSVASHYQALLVLDGLAVVGTVWLGVVAVRQARRRARLEEGAAQRERQADMEARLQEADRLAAVGRMAATLAHEVRNPLEGMRNWLSLAEEEAREAGAQGALAPIGRVGEGIDRLADVVRRVLELARPSRRAFESLDLDAVVRDGLASVQGSRPFRAHRLSVALAGDLPRIRGDRILLGQLLLNLLLNARDASPEGGEIRVETSAQGSEVRLAVRDDGPGIPDDLKPRLFEAFASGKGSTGLGLSLCARVAQVHAGRIEAENLARGGACFILSLSAEGAEPPAVEEVPS